MPKPLDITGKKYGKLTAIKKSHSLNGAWWFCQCECGDISAYKVSALQAGKTNSCGCSRLNDLTGKRFERLTVISRSENRSGMTAWKCKCDCGNTVTVNSNSLLAGTTKSCGCYGRDVHRTHGLSRHPLFKTWQHMMNRCYKKTDPAYKNYGGRGIKVSKRWHDPKLFIKDMSPRPEGTSIERINNNLGYSKQNCKWADRKEQATNRRTTQLITFNNQTTSILEWSRITGINRRTISQRLLKGWSVEDALTKPPSH